MTYDRRSGEADIVSRHLVLPHGSEILGFHDGDIRCFRINRQIVIVDNRSSAIYVNFIKTMIYLAELLLDKVIRLDSPRPPATLQQ